MNTKIRDTIFFLMVFVLIFDNIPKPVQLNFIGGPVGSKLEVYPLLAGFLYSFYCQYKYGGVFVDCKRFCQYVAVFVAVMLVSTVVGLVTYPYYDLLLNGPVNQIEKLPKVLAFCQAHGISVNAKLLMQAWLVVRTLKGVLLEAFWCFGGAYIVYCWYKNEWQRAVEVLTKAVLSFVMVLFLYAAVEVPYLAGNQTAARILSAINPYIHTVVTNHGWWPPLLWKGQLRLVFPEPSHVGNIIAIAVPVIIGNYYIYKKQTRITLFVITVMSFLVFLSNARTAYAMLFGMLTLLFLLLLFSKRVDFFKKYVCILVCVAVGFACYVNFASSTKDNHVNSQNKISESKVAVNALQNNFASLASSNQRSNKARYALIKAYTRTGMQHPFFGVGNGLTSAYVERNFTAEEAKDREVAMWIKYQQQYGPMAPGYALPGALNEFVDRFSNSGLMGLGIFCMPFIYVLYKLLKLYYVNGDMQAMFIAFAIISLLVAGCNGSVNVLCAIWLLLGLGYAIAFGTPVKEQKDTREPA